jgi:hypothetical protein
MTDTAVSVDYVADAHHALKEHLKARVRVIAQYGHGDQLRRSVGLAQLPALSNCTNEATLDRWVAIVQHIEDQHLLPYPNQDPRWPSGRWQDVIKDEHGYARAEDLAGLRAALELQPLAPWIAALVETTGRAGRSISLSVFPSQRRWEIGWALIALSSVPVETAEAWLVDICGDDRPLDRLIGDMTVEQAQQIQTRHKETHNHD